MESKDALKYKNEELHTKKPKHQLDNIKSYYFIHNIFDNIVLHRTLEIVKCNKKLQKKLNINIKNYQIYSGIYTTIEIEIIPAKNKYGQFINIDKDEDIYYDIYFNDDKTKIKRTFINKEDNVSKINIIIGINVFFFDKLFENCECIESINFKKFSRTTIYSMDSMFKGCSSLKELKLSKFNTYNVLSMEKMFKGCSSLKELNLSNFNTINVKNMHGMFSKCSSLKLLNISNFNTNNVRNMNCMFKGCSSLKELDLSNFNTIA